MNSILSEKEYQSFIIDRLKENGYEVSLAKDFDRQFAVNRKDLFKFLNTTQPEKMEKLYKIYKQDTEDTIVATINNEKVKNKGSRLYTLKKVYQLLIFNWI